MTVSYVCQWGFLIPVGWGESCTALVNREKDFWVGGLGWECQCCRLPLTRWTTSHCRVCSTPLHIWPTRHTPLQALEHQIWSSECCSGWPRCTTATASPSRVLQLSQKRWIRPTIRDFLSGSDPTSVIPWALLYREGSVLKSWCYWLVGIRVQR